MTPHFDLKKEKETFEKLITKLTDLSEKLFPIEHKDHKDYKEFISRQDKFQEAMLQLTDQIANAHTFIETMSSTISAKQKERSEVSKSLQKYWPGENTIIETFENTCKEFLAHVPNTSSRELQKNAQDLIKELKVSFSRAVTELQSFVDLIPEPAPDKREKKTKKI